MDSILVGMVMRAIRQKQEERVNNPILVLSQDLYESTKSSIIWPIKFRVDPTLGPNTFRVEEVK